MSIVPGKIDGLLIVGEAVCFFRYLCVSLRLSAGEADLQHTHTHTQHFSGLRL